MKLDSFILIYENIFLIIGFVILTKPFYIWFYKYKKSDSGLNKQEKISKKNIYLNRIDIIENKVYIVIGIVLSLILIIIRII